jgi:Na+/proline symporter
MFGVGLAVPALVAEGAMREPAHPDQAAAIFLLEFTPELLAGVVFASILAATMSTADSLVNIASAALVRDLPRAFGWRVRHELAWGRVATVAIAVAAAVFAHSYGALMLLLGAFSFGVFAATLTPALAVGLNWARVTPGAACASIATGLVLAPGLELLGRHELLPFAPGVMPTAVALSASTAVLMLWTWLAGRPEGDALDADVRAVMDA